MIRDLDCFLSSYKLVVRLTVLCCAAALVYFAVFSDLTDRICLQEAGPGNPAVQSSTADEGRHFYDR
jgi:hypothetical protein